MIDHAQSGPFSWWEGVGYPEADGGIWASGGSGSGAVRARICGGRAPRQKSCGILLLFRKPIQHCLSAGECRQNG